MTDSDVPVVQLDEALARVGGDWDFYRELLDMLLEDAPGQVAEIKEALEAGDAPRVELIAHSLKGAAASLGAGPMRDVALELELMGEDHRLDNASRVIAELETRLEELTSYVVGL